jgi:hypothetical protein
MMKVAADLSDFVRRMEEIQERISSRSVGIASKVIIGEVELLTKQGLKFDGTRMKAYSKQWAKVRTKHGRQTDHVDFVFNNEMMPTLNLYGETITVGSQYQAQAEGLNKDREWMNVSQTTADKIADAIAEDLDIELE